MSAAQADQLAWMEMHARLLFPHDEAGNICNQRNMPRLYLGSTSVANICRTRSDLQPSDADRLKQLARDEPAAPFPHGRPVHGDEYESILTESAPIERRWTGPAYRFPDVIADHQHEVAIIDHANVDLLKANHSDWIPAVGYADPVCVLLVRGVVVSICFSARINREACEAGVDTLKGFRGNGYAASVVAAWASAVRLRGLEPLYSTSSDNKASQSVARKLGLLPIGMDFHLT